MAYLGPETGISVSPALGSQKLVQILGHTFAFIQEAQCLLGWLQNLLTFYQYSINVKHKGWRSLAVLSSVQQSPGGSGQSRSGSVSELSRHPAKLTGWGPSEAAKSPDSCCSMPRHIEAQRQEVAPND